MERQRQIKGELKIPLIFKQFIDYLKEFGLKEVGIFRLAGHHAEIMQINNKIDEGEEIIFDFKTNAHNVAALFKKYLRDLPTPLLTFDLYTKLVGNTRLFFSLF